MNLHRTKIEWATHTWNPVTGCLHGCDYCYARRFISRFQPHACERPRDDEISGTGIFEIPSTTPPIYYVTHPARLVDEHGQYARSTPYPKGFAPTFHAYTMQYPEKRFIPSRVFVSSMGDLFGEWVPDDWIEAIFEACKRGPQHTYLFLTKNPERYAKLDDAGKLPDGSNMWYGATVADAAQMQRAADAFGDLPEGVNTFLSIEPLMEDITASPGWAQANNGQYARWLIIGAMTGPGSKQYQPKREWVEALVADAEDGAIPVFMKDSLKDVWGPDLLREHPGGGAVPHSYE